MLRLPPPVCHCRSGPLVVETGVKAHRATQRSSSPGKAPPHRRAAVMRSHHMRACFISMSVIPRRGVRSQPRCFSHTLSRPPRPPHITAARLFPRAPQPATHFPAPLFKWRATKNAGAIGALQSLSCLIKAPEPTDHFLPSSSAPH